MCIFFSIERNWKALVFIGIILCCTGSSIPQKVHTVLLFDIHICGKCLEYWSTEARAMAIWLNL